MNTPHYITCTLPVFLGIALSVYESKVIHVHTVKELEEVKL